LTNPYDYQRIINGIGYVVVNCGYKLGLANFMMCFICFPFLDFGAGTPVTFFIKYIHVFNPAGQPVAVQVGSKPTCASAKKVTK